MIDHITVAVRDYPRAKAFFAAALEPLGYEVAMEFGNFCGLGVGGKPDLWLAAEDGQHPVGAQHLAFAARDRKAVDAFHAAALAAGAADNGKPGLRPDYHPGYYGAFVLDADGHNLEAVCHAPPKKAARKPARRAAAPKRRAGTKAAGRRKRR
jgi:catechol 2,3-dioxygenase-like lactoylglutathione lyase family enzyme